MQPPLPARTAWAGVARSVFRTVLLLRHRQIRQPHRLVGAALRFADGTEGRVYRETALERPPSADPCVLVVAFRLRLVRGRAHAVFRLESELNTPLFVGFPGFVTKLWLAHDRLGTYRGIYEWDGAERAERYARSLWHVLALVSEPGSIAYQVLPGVQREEFLAQPDAWAGDEPGTGAWWRVTEVR
jgi:hypothetical protein